MRVFESNGEEAFQQAGVSELQVKMVFERPPAAFGGSPPQRGGE
jgi:hypothetical protein